MNIKNTWTRGLTVGALLCAAGAALGQTSTDHSQAGEIPAARVLSGFNSGPPPTPEEVAANELSGQLQESAAKELDAGQFAQAEADARQALAVDNPASGRVWETLAGSLDAQGKDREALQAYGHLVGQGYNPPRTWLPYALLLLKAGQWAPAVEAYNKALPNITADGGNLLRANSHFSPDTPEPRALVTAVHIALALTQVDIAALGTGSQKDRALAHFQTALDLSPDSDMANFFYGYGLQKLGRTSQANAAFQKTIKMAKGSVKLAAEQALKKNKKPA